MMAAVYLRAQRIAQEYDLEVLQEDDIIVPMGDLRKERIEHILHELAHGALLGLLYGPRLAERVSRRVQALGSADADQNEVETYAVVMAALDRLRLSYDPQVMYEALQPVLGTEPAQEQVQGLWDDFGVTVPCVRAVDRVISLFEGM